MQVTLSQLTKYFLRLGAIGFGGPIALCAQMKAELVDKLHWFSLQEYEEGFTFSQTAPGPVAFQLAMYLGFIRFGISGATLIGIAFIFTPFVLVIILSALYVQYGSARWLQSVLHGIAPAVAAIVFHAVIQLGKSLLRAWKYVLVTGLSLTLATFFNVDLSLIIIGAGFVGLLYVAFSERMVAGATLMLPLLLQNGGQGAPDSALSVLPKLAWFFFKAGALTFGSGYVVIAFIQRGVVDEYHWLTVQQFLDAIAVGQVTPGPVIITATFVGYLVKGLVGAFVGTLAVLTPVYLITILGAPLVVKYRTNSLLQGFMANANAAAVGVITSVAVKLTTSAVSDWRTGAIFILALAVLVLRNIPSIIIIVLAGGLGALFFPL